MLHVEKAELDNYSTVCRVTYMAAAHAQAAPTSDAVAAGSAEHAVIGIYAASGVNAEHAVCLRHYRASLQLQAAAIGHSNGGAFDLTHVVVCDGVLT
jgi:hypothetical protein